jgi:CubicO group peptidase (beta-lactamase class C family)
MIATKPRSASPASALDEEWLGASIGAMLNRHPAVGMAVGVVREGRLAYFHAHGVANVESHGRIDEGTVFRVASITKTFTAVAVMQLWERGLVDLDAPVNRYLRAFRLVPAKPGFRPATLRHLLTHTSGIPEMVRPSRALKYVYGESYRLDETVPALGEYYKGALRLQTEPGTMFRYTDHNFAVAGQVVEDVTGEPIADYLRAHVFIPLGMTGTDLERTPQIASRIATGYTLGRRGPRPVTDRRWQTAAASMTYSSTRDMARYVAAMLGEGSNEFGTVLGPEAMAMMFAPQYQPDPRIPGIGLAFDRANLSGHAVVGHEGVLPGFNSQIFCALDDGIGVLMFTNGAPGAMLWLPEVAARLLGELIGATPDTIRTDVPQHPEIWPDLVGWYPLVAPLTDMRLRAMLGAGAQVRVRHGRLWIRVLSPIPAALGGFELHPDDEHDPYVFRIDMSRFGMGSGRIVFSTGGGRTRAHLDMLPVSLARKENRR